MQRDVDELVRYLGADLGITKSGYLVKNAMPGQGTGIRQGGKLYAPGLEEGGGEELMIGMLSQGMAWQKTPLMPPILPKEWKLWYTFPEIPEFDPYQLRNIVSAGTYQGELYLILQGEYGFYSRYAFVRYAPESNTFELIAMDISPPYAVNMVEWDDKLWFGALGYYDGSDITYIDEYAEGMSVYEGDFYLISANGISILHTGETTPTLQYEFPFSAEWSTAGWTYTFAEWDGTLYAAILSKNISVSPNEFFLRVLRLNGSTWSISYENNCTENPYRPLSLIVQNDTLKMITIDALTNNRFAVWGLDGTWQEQTAIKGYWGYVSPYSPSVLDTTLWFYNTNYGSNAKIYSLSADSTEIQTVYTPEFSHPTSWLVCGMFQFEGVLYAAGGRDIFAY